MSAVASEAFLPAGANAPDFSLRDQNNEVVVLSELLADGPVLLVFYPAAFTGTCTGELQHLQADRAVYEQCGVETLALSVDSPFSQKVFAEREGFTFSLLSDFWPHGEVAARFGVFDEARGLAKRGTFLIDGAGVIAFSEMNDIGHARDPQRWVELVRELAGR